MANLVKKNRQRVGERGDFGENGIFVENGEYGKHLTKS